MSATEQILGVDPATWHRSAARWAALADELDLAEAQLEGGARALPGAWPAGGAADPARARVEAARGAIGGASEPARRIATALAEHAYALAALRRLATEQLTAAERTGLAARARELDERTRAVLTASQPPASTQPWTAQSGVVQGVPPDLDPGQVHAWWAGLSTSERETLLRERPQVLGWLDGLPATVRDRANRAVLDARLGALHQREATLAQRLEWLRLGLPPLLTPPPLIPVVALVEWELAGVRAEWAALQAVRDTLVRLGPDALLLGIDGRGDGRVVLALGDPDHATHTAVFVPGANTELRDAAGGLGQVERLWHAADAMTKEPDDIAAVYWLGYDAPGTFGALGWDASRSGAEHLAPFLHGLGAAHDPLPGHVTLVGHSYGTTVVAEAALRGGLGIDDIVVTGSPGMHTAHAADLLDPRHVWSGVAADDPIGGPLGALPFVHGEEPTDASFGGNRFLVDTHGHGGYWDPGSASLRNQAAIVAGRYDLVRLVHGAAPAG